MSDNCSYETGVSFLLHVFWEAPNLSAAHELLSGLKKCATATHRDTPCTPTYFFRISTKDSELCEKVLLIKDHVQITAAKKKLQIGASVGAVHSYLQKLGVDVSLLEEDSSNELPLNLQRNPVYVEFTEVYLDDNAFLNHARSRDFLDGYAILMNPSMHNKIPQTWRLGTPSAKIIEILEPVLKEIVVPMRDGFKIWQKPQNIKSTISIFISLDFLAIEGEDSVASMQNILPNELKDESITFVAFLHPHRENTVRVMCITTQLPFTSTLTGIAEMQPQRGVIHIQPLGLYDDGVKDGGTNTSSTAVVEDMVSEFKLSLQTVHLENVILVNQSDSVGFILHEKVDELKCNDTV